MNGPTAERWETWQARVRARARPRNSLNLSQFVSRFRLRTDRGSEFKSRGFQRLLREFDIEHSFPYVHAAMVERVQQTLQRILAFWLTENETTRYIDHFQDVINVYNSRYHRAM